VPQHSNNRLNVKSHDIEINAKSRSPISCWTLPFGCTVIRVGEPQKPRGFWGRYLRWRILIWMATAILIAGGAFVARFYAQGIPLLGGP